MKAPTVLGAMSLTLALVACTTESVDLTSSDEAAATVGDDAVDCFPQCAQADWEALMKDGLDKACAGLVAGWKDPARQDPPQVDWPGWNPKKPICIGFRSDIVGRTDCNRLVDAPGYTSCANQAMLLCAKENEPGFGPIILVPPKGGFPKPRPSPSTTDSELACIKQWACAVKNPKALPKSLGVRATATCEGDACLECDSSWFVEESPMSTEEPVHTLMPVEESAFGL